MQSLTLSQVREVLSGPAASAFFEAWDGLDSARTHAEERIDDLISQAFAAELRVRGAERAATNAAQRAEEQRRRALDVSLESTDGAFAKIEADALARSLSVRTEEGLAEARERRRRAAHFMSQASEAREQLSTIQQARADLRASAAHLGGHVGEACLFFADAEQPGGAFVVPLSHVSLEGRDLEVFVLHRLAPGAPLEEATAIRDAPPEGLPDLPDETGTSLDDTPSERAQLQQKEMT